MKQIVLCFFVCIILMSCSSKSEHAINFYHWRTNVTFSDTEKQYLKQLDCKKMYIRVFDLDKQLGEEAAPIAKISRFDAKQLNIEYVPTVFITNHTFFGISSGGIDTLAYKMSRLIEKICETNNMGVVNEWQFDCDWTGTTRDDYFKFLETIKKYAKRDVSCTIRLHQVANPQKTGVPPVDKGFLMCYATSQPKDFNDKNSILDIALFEKYIQNVDNYPLKLDIALPLYSWAIVANHLGKIKLINGVTQADLKNEKNLRLLKDGIYEATEDFVFRGMYLNKGFQIKVEDVGAKLLSEAREAIDKKLTSDYSIVYYHLDERFLGQFKTDDLK